jgi:hypothetical protein
MSDTAAESSTSAAATAPAAPTAAADAVNNRMSHKRPCDVCSFRNEWLQRQALAVQLQPVVLQGSGIQDVINK